MSLQSIIGNFIDLQYCHYVAGIVGIGLSQLFWALGLEDRLVGEDTSALSSSTWHFLQKIDITKDYFDDVMQGRQFWPKEVIYLTAILTLPNLIWSNPSLI